MRDLQEIKANPRIGIIQESPDGLQAWWQHPKYKATEMLVIFSWGGGWEHASASFKKRCPTWDEMCAVKEAFWRDDECVIQFHPPKSEYVNNYPFCLHLWKKIGNDFELPPSIYVGYKNKSY